MERSGHRGFNRRALVIAAADAFISRQLQALAKQAQKVPEHVLEGYRRFTRNQYLGRYGRSHHLPWPHSDHSQARERERRRIGGFHVERAKLRAQINDAVLAKFGDSQAAFAIARQWWRTPDPVYGRTPQELVKQGRHEWVLGILGVSHG